MTVLPSILFQSHPASNIPAQHAVDAEVDTYLTTACHLAKQILAPTDYGITEDYSQRGRVRIKPYRIWTPTPIIVQQPVYVHGGRNRQDNGKPSDALRVVAGVVAAACGGFAVYKVGQSINHIRDAGEEITSNRQFQSQIGNWDNELRARGGQDNRVIRALDVIAAKKDSIFSRIKENAILNLVIAISVAVAAVFTLIGAVMASYPFLTAGLAFAVVTAAAFLFKLGYMSSDKRDQQDATAIKTEIDMLRGAQFYQNAVRQ